MPVRYLAWKENIIRGCRKSLLFACLYWIVVSTPKWRSQVKNYVFIESRLCILVSNSTDYDFSVLIMLDILSIKNNVSPTEAGWTGRIPIPSSGSEVTPSSLSSNHCLRLLRILIYSWIKMVTFILIFV